MLGREREKGGLRGPLRNFRHLTRISERKALTNFRYLIWIKEWFCEMRYIKAKVVNSIRASKLKI